MMMNVVHCLVPFAILVVVLAKPKPPGQPKDCAQFQKQGSTNSGEYTIFTGDCKKEVYCDLTTNGGGWTVIQRRVSDKVDFYRSWKDYVEGFGDWDGNFWIGLNTIRGLTAEQNTLLRIELTSRLKEKGIAEYSDFRVEAPDKQFRLFFSEYLSDSSTAGDSLAPHRGQPFSANNETAQHSESLHGAWWYPLNQQAGNISSNLNGIFGEKAREKPGMGLSWGTWRNEVLQGSEMKIRPMAFLVANKQNCTESLCKNGATCVEARTGLLCLCSFGYVGDRCQDAMSIGVEQATVHGVVTPDEALQVTQAPKLEQGFQCKKTRGGEFECWRRGPTGVEQCNEKPCRNGGTCVPRAGIFLCRCTSMFTGRLCVERQPCANITCQNGGSCEPLDSGGIRCACALGFTGARCEQQHACATQPCQNGGSCVEQNTSTAGMYACSCADGFHGFNCELVDPCRCGPCANGGTCVTSGDESFTCNCMDGYQGSQCQRASPCQRRPCFNGGMCQPIGAGTDFLCICLSGYKGRNCEITPIQEPPMFEQGFRTDALPAGAVAVPLVGTERGMLPPNSHSIVGGGRVADEEDEEVQVFNVVNTMTGGQSSTEDLLATIARERMGKIKARKWTFIVMVIVTLTIIAVATTIGWALTTRFARGKKNVTIHEGSALLRKKKRRRSRHDSRSSSDSGSEAGSVAGSVAGSDTESIPESPQGSDTESVSGKSKEKKDKKEKSEKKEKGKKEKGAKDGEGKEKREKGKKEKGDKGKDKKEKGAKEKGDKGKEKKAKGAKEKGDKGNDKKEKGKEKGKKEKKNKKEKKEKKEKKAKK